MTPADFLDKAVIAKWRGSQRTRLIGKCVGYCSEPMLLIQDDSGNTIHWALSLCELAVAPVEASMANDAAEKEKIT